MTEPIKVILEKDKKYSFCTCNKSIDPIFCNGEHRETTKNPISFSVDESKEYYLCACKHSKIMPYCDGSHKTNSIKITKK